MIDKITGAGVMQISPANTSDQFTTYNDNGLYFRTAPPDLLQARALADLIGQTATTPSASSARNDPYGTGLAKNTEKNLVDRRSVRGRRQERHLRPQAANYDAEIQQMADFNPDAIVVIGFEESSRIIQGLNARASARSADRLIGM